MDHLRSMGADASGEIGSRDPIEAVQDALRGHPCDEIILSTLPPGISRWLGQDVPTRLRGSVAAAGQRRHRRARIGRGRGLTRDGPSPGVRIA